MAHVKQVLATTNQINEFAKENEKGAINANSLSSIDIENATIGNSQMNELLVSIENIKQSSSDIFRVIKVINDITFQTNLLALNASIEAAQAGVYGKGVFCSCGRSSQPCYKKSRCS